MALVSHQTVRLGRGDHRDARAGMCVLELASVLAGNEFGAYPRSVCPVIAAFLRCYNDLVDDRRRQDLIPCAAAVVGSRASARLETRRARICRRWVASVARPGFWARPFWTLLAIRRRSRNEAAATYAALVALDGERHAAALELVDRLLAESGGPTRWSAPTPRKEQEVEVAR
jgi:hypothetical protein